MTIITLQAEGGVSVRIGEEAAVLIQPGTAEAHRTGLTPNADPAAVEELLAEGTCAASADARLTAAVASYALSLAPLELSEAVVAGALRCNPDASDDLEVAAGIQERTADVGVVDFGSGGGISGAGSQELPRTGRPFQL